MSNRCVQHTVFFYSFWFNGSKQTTKQTKNNIKHTIQQDYTVV